MQYVFIAYIIVLVRPYGALLEHYLFILLNLLESLYKIVINT